MRADATADSILIMNTVFYNNGSGGSWDKVVVDGSKIVSFNNIIHPYNGPGGYPELNVSRGNGSIYEDIDPFQNSSENDYNLSDFSSAIGAGISQINFSGFTVQSPSTDLNGQNRPNPIGSNPDMGAIENALAIRKILPSQLTKMEVGSSQQFSLL